MGTNKALLDLDGCTVIERIARMLLTLFPRVLIVTNTPVCPPGRPEDYGHLDLPVYRDLVSDYGPLGGIYTGLRVSEHFGNLFVPCDMPFIDEAHIRPLVEHRARADVVIYRHRKAEPLFGLYNQRCLPPIQEMIERGQRCPLDLFPMVRLRQLPCSERDVAFLNLNSMQDYHTALEIARGNRISYSHTH